MTQRQSFVIASHVATGIEIDGAARRIRLSGGGVMSCRAATIATGVSYRRLTSPGVEELAGSGVFYEDVFRPSTEMGTTASPHTRKRWGPERWLS